ncbi:TetR/AcrR family transcriptional regulator [Microbacterium indicum]|uniref:TetR/AcrR family transcriptional regulator n=1 Tax=Microbacterium indicum TaxID=358100 RepID=UPI00146CF566|nr:TetR/AcrR family transcriptional regulator [Microbacterium indicum]
MGRHGDRVREQLMDAAERLYASEGVAAVSARQIADAAGMSNHSAVAYHFGGRDELLEALVGRHTEATLARRRELEAALGAEPTAQEILATRLMPFVENLDALPRPSWRARFLVQAAAHPAGREILARVTRTTEVSEGVGVLARLAPGVPRRVIGARSAIVGGLVLNVCAGYEAQAAVGIEESGWIGVGWFLVDAAAGMLTAPVMHPGGIGTPPDPLL